MAVVHFKFQKSATPAEQETVKDELHTSKVRSVKALFPGHRSSSLARLYSVETPDQESAAEVLEVLRKSDSVEYAEEAAERSPL
jgi:hypothetical protein